MSSQAIIDFIHLASDASPLGVDVAWQLNASIYDGLMLASYIANCIALIKPTPVSVGLRT